MLPKKVITTAMSALAGASHAENEYHVMAYAVFMNRLVRYPSCKALFMKWEHMTGLYEPVTYLRAVVEEFHILNQLPPVGEERAKVLMDALVEASLLFITAMHTYDHTALELDAAQYINNELYLPWGWLKTELITAWKQTVSSWATSIEIETALYYQRAKVDPPPLQYTFTPEAHEQPDEIIRRMKHETKQIAKDVKSHQRVHDLPPGRKSWQPEDVERYVEWFFRNKIRNEGIRRISNYDMDGNEIPKHNRYGRKEIGIGIGHAERWLSAGDPQDGGASEKE